MLGMAEPEMMRSDTTATDSSGEPSHGVQSSSPNPPIFLDPITSEHPSSQPRPGKSSGRKRKSPDSVTANACTNCKKARAKVGPCFHMSHILLHDRMWHTKLSAIVRRSRASLPTLREPSHSRLLSLRDPC